MAKFISTSLYSELYNLCNTGPIEYSITSDLRQYYIETYTHGSMKSDDPYAVGDGWSTIVLRTACSRERGKKYTSVLYNVYERFDIPVYAGSIESRPTISIK